MIYCFVIIVITVCLLDIERQLSESKTLDKCVEGREESGSSSERLEINIRDPNNMKNYASKDYAICVETTIQTSVLTHWSNLNKLFTLSRKIYSIVKKDARHNLKRAQVLLNRHKIENKVSKELAGKVPASTMEC